MCGSQASSEAVRNTLFFLRGCIRGCQLLPQHPRLTVWEFASGRAEAFVSGAHELSCRVHQEIHQRLRWLLSSRDVRLFKVKLPPSLAKPSQLYPLLLPGSPGKGNSAITSVMCLSYRYKLNWDSSAGDVMLLMMILCNPRRCPTPALAQRPMRTGASRFACERDRWG